MKHIRKVTMGKAVIDDFGQMFLQLWWAVFSFILTAGKSGY